MPQHLKQRASALLTYTSQDAVNPAKVVVKFSRGFYFIHVATTFDFATSIIRAYLDTFFWFYVLNFIIFGIIKMY